MSLRSFGEAIRWLSLGRSEPCWSPARPSQCLSCEIVHRAAIRETIQHSLILFLTFIMVWIFWVVITPLAPHGLPVHLIRPGVTAPRSPGIQPLLVRIVGDGHSAKLYVGSDPVAWEDLGALLKKELAQRPPGWPVYIVGDPDVEWRQVAEVIDAVRGQQAKVILLTDAPKSA